VLPNTSPHAELGGGQRPESAIAKNMTRRLRAGTPGDFVPYLTSRFITKFGFLWFSLGDPNNQITKYLVIWVILLFGSGDPNNQIWQFG
jgi:hypothetical protein